MDQHSARRLVEMGYNIVHNDKAWRNRLRMDDDKKQGVETQNRIYRQKLKEDIKRIAQEAAKNRYENDYNNLYCGIHGISHCYRTGMIALKIAAEIGLDAWEWHEGVIILASVCHDIGRADDGHDPEHGFRGAAMVRDAMSHADCNLSLARWGEVAFAIANHNRVHNMTDPLG